MALTDTRLYQDLSNLGVRKLALIGGVLGLALLALAALLLGATGSGPQELLYSQLSRQKAGEVVGQLDQMGVDYTLKGGGTTIMVPEGRAARIRMRLAQQGVPSGQATGYEILDRQDPMGMTDFMQRVQRVRALEGELAQSVQSLSNVRQARVHVVMPDRQPFAREAPTPKASVVVEAASAGGIGKDRAAAMRALVASAVPKLAPEKVTVLDGSGAVITADETDGPNTGDDLAQIRKRREAQLQQAIREVLAPYVGRANVRASVTAEIERSATTVTEKSYDPEERVLRSVQSVQKTKSSQEQDEANVSAGQNTPAGGAQGEAGQESSQAERREETRNFEISNTQRTSRQPAGKLQALNVAVVVDGTYKTAEGEYVPRSDQEMERIRELVRSAVGYEAERGDSLSVENVRFREMQAGTEPAGPPDREQAGAGIGLWDALAIAVGALVLLLFLLFLRRALQARQGGRQASGQPELVEETPGELTAVGGPESASAQGPPSETVNIRGEEHQVQRDTMTRVARAIEDTPERAAFAVRQMLARDTRAT